MSTTAEEGTNPGRDLPRGILLFLGICTAIYVAVALVVTGMTGYADLAGKADPLAAVFAGHRLPGVAGFVPLRAIVATTSALLVYQVGQSRIFLAMSRDGLLGPWFGKVGRHGTPANATVFTGALVALPAALLNMDEAMELTNIGAIFAFSIVCADVMILRLRRPDRQPPADPRGSQDPVVPWNLPGSRRTLGHGPTRLRPS